MCCETGLCGVGVNPELMRISTVLDNLKKNGIAVTRYNLSNAPQQFLKNQEINKILNEKGPKVLPITMIDGKIEITGRYPTNGEIVMLLNISPDFLNATQKSGGCCSDNENKSSGCCNGNENKSGGCC
jgi:hypothetical protein